MTIDIGGIRLQGRVLSAPFSGISNSPFRVLARRHGASLVFTEMIKARAWVDRNRKTEWMLRFAPQERPVFAQIATGCPDEAARTTELAFAAGYDGLDLNLGCPVKKISKAKSGAFLMGAPDLAGDIVRAMDRAADAMRTPGRPFPITAKMRAGLSRDCVNAVDVATYLVDCGARAITIHARTKDQVHSGETKWQVVQRAKQTLPVPVFYNGSVNSPQIAKRVMELTGCDGVMIGRASFGNPWIFGRVERMLREGVLDRTAPTVREVRETLQFHFQALRELFADFTACRLMRRYAPWYIHGVQGGARFRHELSRLDHPDRFEEILDRLFGGLPAELPVPMADWYDAKVVRPHGTATASADAEVPVHRDAPQAADFD